MITFSNPQILVEHSPNPGEAPKYICLDHLYTESRTLLFRGYAENLVHLPVVHVFQDGEYFLINTAEGCLTWKWLNNPRNWILPRWRPLATGMLQATVQRAVKGDIHYQLVTDTEKFMELWNNQLKFNPSVFA